MFLFCSEKERKSDEERKEEERRLSAGHRRIERSRFRLHADVSAFGPGRAV